MIMIRHRDFILYNVSIMHTQIKKIFKKTHLKLCL